MKILAIDPGYRHTGLAMYDDASGVSPLATINHKDQFELLSRLRRFIEDYSFDKILVGDMGMGANSDFVLRLVNTLVREFSISAELVSEKRSSIQAKQDALNYEVASKKDDHASSAVQILRDYISMLS